jgi:toxin-antitoxin system PIN domain toxin
VRYLLDVNLLLAAIWANHSRHSDAFAWVSGKNLVVCPLSELGFLRISTNKRVINAPMEQARSLLERFLEERQVERIADDLPALCSSPSTSEQVTDNYLADLAAKHGLKLATLDRRLSHPQAEAIA